MKKTVASLLCLLLLLTTTIVFASSTSDQPIKKDITFVETPMDELIKEDNVRIQKFLNKDLGKISSLITPQWEAHEWFERYEPSTFTEKKDAFLAAEVNFDTTGEAGTYTDYTLTVNNARNFTQQVSGTTTITAEISASMLKAMNAKLAASSGATVGSSYSNYNEVGASHTYQVYTYRTGVLRAYHKGYYTKGSIVYGYETIDGDRGEYVKGNGNDIAPYNDDVTRLYFAAPIYD